MDYKNIREQIRRYLSSREAAKHFLENSVKIDVTMDGFFIVREERTPSCKINKDGSCHDYGTGEHYSDMVSLLYDGYHAFDSLPETMEWLCSELDIKYGGIL